MRKSFLCEGILIMTAREYLEQIVGSEKYIEFQEAHIKMVLNSAIYKCNTISKEPTAKSQGDSMSKKISHSIDLANALERIKEKTLKKRAKIANEIDALPDNMQKSVLGYTYLLDKTDREIARQLNYGEDNIRIIRKKGLVEFERLHHITLKYSKLPHFLPKNVV